MDVIKYLAAEAKAAPQGAATPSLLFLTPCHATPLYSHLHIRLSTRFVDCSPPGWAPAVARLNAGALAWPRRQVSHGSFVGVSAQRPHDARRSCEAPQPGIADSGQCDTQESRRGSCASTSSLRSGAAAIVHATTQVAASSVDTAAATHPADIRSERQRFEADPLAWLATRYPPTATDGAALPTYVILFSDQLAAVEGWLQEGGYRLSRDFFHTHFAVDNGHQARVLVFTSSTG